MTPAAWLFWIFGIGGAIALQAWRIWQRRRCLADPCFARGADGQGVFAGQTIDDADRARLMGWQRRMIAVFAGGMAFMALFLIVALLGLVDEDRPIVFVAALFLLVAIAAGVQFSARCPRCRYPLGLQSRLLLPHACERCGVALRDRPPPPATRTG